MTPKPGQVFDPALFASLAVLALACEAVGWMAGRFGLAGLAVAAVAALLAAWAGLSRWQRSRAETGRLQAEVERLAPLQDALALRAEQHRKLRHDLRGALSPALLTADRLLGNADPKVKRAGEMMVLAVERASALMADD